MSDEVTDFKSLTDNGFKHAAVVKQAELETWGRTLGPAIRPPYWLTIQGELGAGKSVLARAIAAGLGVSAAMPSPTFGLCFRYPGAGSVEVVHLDLYRLSGPEDLDELGWDELGAENEVIIVEWPERAGERLPPTRLEIRLDSGPSSDLRRLEWRVVGPASHPQIPRPAEARHDC